MRSVLVAIAIVLATCAAACGGDDSGTAEPLTLEQRLLRESEAAGSKPDPVETRLTARNLEEFNGWQSKGYVAAAEIDSQDLEDAGFVAAVHDTRFFPKMPGGDHTRDAPHVRLLVVQFESDDGAAEGADLLRKQSLKPCPGQCSMSIEEFDVSGVPDAQGLRHFVTEEKLKELGEPGEPRDGYSIFFADGPFAYELEIFGPPGDVSEDQIEEIGSELHHRVEGAPPAET